MRRILIPLVAIIIARARRQRTFALNIKDPAVSYHERVNIDAIRLHIQYRHHHLYCMIDRLIIYNKKTKKLHQITHDEIDYIRIALVYPSNKPHFPRPRRLIQCVHASQTITPLLDNMYDQYIFGRFVTYCQENEIKLQTHHRHEPVPAS